MKRILVMLLAFAMLLALAACELDAPTTANKKPRETKPSASATQPTQPTAKPTTAPTEPTNAPTVPLTTPPTTPVEPTEPPTEPIVKPTEPTTSPTEPITPPHTHDYKATVTKPTCTEGGYTTYTCDCGDTYQDDSVKALGHSWKEATCTEAKTCTVCKKTEGNAKGHQWEEATCTEAKTCTVCNKTEGSAKGHDFAEGICTRCGAKDPDYNEPELIDGMRPEFKSAMDAYETFMAEYCEFMKKYKANPNDLTLLADYAEFMKQYSDFAQKMNAWKNGEMNDAERKYYMDVITRVTKLLLELEEKPEEAMRPEFKEAMDAYEAAMTEYCDFMKQYKKNPTDLTLLGQYAEMLKKYTAAMQMLQEWDSSEMNSTELQYYMDVTNRVSQMLMDAMG